MAQSTPPGSPNRMPSFNPVVGAGPASHAPVSGFASPGCSTAYNSPRGYISLPHRSSMSYNSTLSRYTSPAGGYNSPMSQKESGSSGGNNTPKNFNSPSESYNALVNSNPSISSVRYRTPSSRFDSPLSRFSSPSDGHSPRFPDGPVKEHPGCSLCYQNRETKAMYMSHRLKDRQGNVTCPILYRVVCPYCKATGSRAHTQSYCPANPGKPNFRFYLQGRNASGGYYK